MTTEIIDGITIIHADEGKIFQRIHDGFVMGNTIYLGTDYSTGTARQDMTDYYQEIDVIVT